MEKSSQPETAFLLLLLLDGRLCCVSLEDGGVRWSAQHPGGQLLHCGRRDISEDETQASTPSLASSTHTNSQNLSDCGRHELCADDSTVGRSSPLEELLGTVDAGCCLVSAPPFSDAAAAPDPKWCFSAASPRVGNRAAWLLADDVLERWNDSVSPARRAVDLKHKRMSYLELDFFTGKQLLWLSSEGEFVKRSEEKFSDASASLRLAVQRTDFTRTVLFPPSKNFPHVGANSAENRISRLWHSGTSTVGLDVLNISEDNSPYEPWVQGEQRLFHIEQTLTRNEFISRLYAVEGPETIQKAEFIDSASPVVSAHIVWRRSCSTTADNVPTLRVKCQEVRVVNFLGHTGEERDSRWNFQERNGNVQSYSGFFDHSRRVLFLDSAPSSRSEGVSFFESPLHETDAVISSMPSSLGIYDGDEQEDGSLTEDNLEEVESRSPSNVSDQMAVLRRKAGASGDRSETGTIVPVNRESSFFDDNFEVFGLLGRGSSAAVLLARHRLTGVFYAIKVVLAPRFFYGNGAQHEAQLHARLENNNLVRYHACWSEEVTPQRLRQLASIGLCHPKEAQRLGLVNGSARIGCVDYQHRAPCEVQGQASWSLASEKVAMKHNLLLAPPQLTQENSPTGLYLAGTESFDSSLFSSRRSGVDSKGEGDANLSRECSPSSSPGSGDLLGSQVVFMQLEYCHTTLAHRLGSRSGIDRIENIIIVLQIFSALRYLHRCGYLHRDVKPTNVLLDYRSQTVALDETSDDEDGEEEEEEEKGVENGVGGKEEVKHMTSSDDVVDALNEYAHTSGMMTTGASPGLSTPFLSALDLIRANANVGSLASILRKWKPSQKASRKKHVIRLVRRWLKRHLVQVRLGDFGLSKLMNDQSIDVSGYFDYTEVNTVGAGSPQYSSPEQLAGGVCTATSDAFSAGVLLAEMYIQPTTVAERLFELRRARENRFPDSALLMQYPELQVVEGLTRRDPASRMTLKDASKVLTNTVDGILYSFFSGISK